MATAKEKYGRYKTRVLETSKTPFDHKNLSKDNFFVDDSEGEDDEKPVFRAEVDKRGNVMKNRHR